MPFSRLSPCLLRSDSLYRLQASAKPVEGRVTIGKAPEVFLKKRWLLFPGVWGIAILCPPFLIPGQSRELPVALIEASTVLIPVACSNATHGPYQNTHPETAPQSQADRAREESSRRGRIHKRGKPRTGLSYAMPVGIMPGEHKPDYRT
jgi:hypothetical protein